MCTVLPAIVLPFLVTLLVTRVPMYEGTPLVGGGLLPPVVVQLGVHLLAGVGGVVVGSVTLPANPLSDDGAVPPVRRFRLHQMSAHQVTVVVGVAAATV